MNSTITVFIDPACGPCNALKDWLKKKGISFIEKDIINDEGAAREFREAGGMYTPTSFVEVGEEKIEIIGWS